LEKVVDRFGKVGAKYERTTKTPSSMDGVEVSNVIAQNEREPEKSTAEPVEPAEAPNLKEWLLGGPKFDDFEVERDKSPGREIEL